MSIKKIIVLASFIIASVMIYLAFSGLPFRPKKLIKPGLLKDNCQFGKQLARNLYPEILSKNFIFWGKKNANDKILECFLEELKINQINIFHKIKLDKLNYDNKEKFLITEDSNLISRLETQNIFINDQKLDLNSISIYFETLIEDQVIDEECFRDSAESRKIKCLKQKKYFEIKHKSKDIKGLWVAAEQVHNNEYVIYFLELK